MLPDVKKQGKDWLFVFKLIPESVGFVLRVSVGEDCQTVKSVSLHLSEISAGMCYTQASYTVRDLESLGFDRNGRLFDEDIRYRSLNHHSEDAWYYCS